MCTVLLPPGVKPIVVNKYIISILKYYGKHPVELKIDIHVRRICVTIKYCCIVIVIHALFNPQFLFSCGEIVNFSFLGMNMHVGTVLFREWPSPSRNT